MIDLHPILAEADFGGVIVVIFILMAGFINWLYNLWKQKGEDAERARRLPTEEEMEHNRRVLAEQQHRQQQEHRHAAPSAPPPLPPSGGGGSLKELFEELKRAAEEAKHAGRPIAQESHREPARPAYPSAPPPLSPASRPVQRAAPPLLTPAVARAHAEPLPQAPLSKEDAGAHLDAARRAAAAYADTSQSRRAPHPLTALLHTAAGYRQAFVLKEVLDTPKGLRQSPWSELP